MKDNVSGASSSTKQRLLLVYHDAALEAPKKLFDAIAACGELQLRVLGPRKGYSTLDREVREIPRSYHGAYDLVTGRVYGANADFSRPYLTGLFREIVRFRPRNIIHVFNEAYSGLYVQAVLYRNWFRPSAKCFCNGAQNVIRQIPRTRMEVLACGLPVLGPRCGAIPEIIGEGGLCFGERDFVGLADCTDRLRSDPGLGARLGQSTQRRAHEFCSSKAVAARPLRLFCRGCSGVGRRAGGMK